MNFIFVLISIKCVKVFSLAFIELQCKYNQSQWRKTFNTKYYVFLDWNCLSFIISCGVFFFSRIDRQVKPCITIFTMCADDVLWPLPNVMGEVELFQTCLTPPSYLCACSKSRAWWQGFSFVAIRRVCIRILASNRHFVSRSDLIFRFCQVGFFFCVITYYTFLVLIIVEGLR